MTKQRILTAIAVTVAMGILGAGCSSNNDVAANKTPVQIQAAAQKSAADQAGVFQQRQSIQGQTGQPGQSAAQSQAAGMAAHYGQQGQPGQAH